MHSHLDIKVNGKSLVIPEDSSLSVEEKNPLFNDVTFFSYPMQIPVEGNREVLKNIAHRDSDMRAMDLEHAEASIFAEGLPLNSGQVITQDGSEIKDTFEFNIDAQQQSFSELIGGLECQDVRVKDRLVIGEKIGKVFYKYHVHGEEYYFDSETGVKATAPYPFETPFFQKIKPSNENIFTYDGSGDTDSMQALGFSYPARCNGFPKADTENGEPVIKESFINVALPYPFPYCNSRVAYAHPGISADGTETEGTVKGNSQKGDSDFGQYWCLDAFRQQSGICFYVLYFLDCLFEQLGVSFDKSELLEIEDFSRLAFFTTQCHYNEELKHYNVTFNNGGASYNSLSAALAAISDEDRTPGMDIAFKGVDGKYVRYSPLTTAWSSNPSDWSGPFVAEVLSDDEISEWTESRKTGGTIKMSVHVGRPARRSKNYEEYYELPNEYIEGSGTFSHDDMYSTFPVKVTFNPPKSKDDWATWRNYYRKVEGEVHFETEIYDMVANSENFPKTSVSSVISSLENSFGIRFLYDPEKRSVTARLLRNVYKTKVCRRFNGTVLSMIPLNEKITGVRMAYSAESEAKEQKNNVRYGIRDYNTDYDYIDYPKERTVTDLTYQTITSKVASTNRNVYIDLTTGNSFRIKVDSEAKDIISLRPTLFQVGQWKGVEIGDCSEQNKDYVKEFISEITPLSLNVINAKDYNSDTTGSVSPVLAPFLDVEMEHEYLEQRIQNVAKDIAEPRYTKVRTTKYEGDYNGYGFPENIQILITQSLKLQESYDPTQTEYGNSPLQDIDWGLTLAVMRGPGTGTSGYISPGDGSTAIALTWEQFKVIMSDKFGPVGGNSFSSNISIGDFYDSISSRPDGETLDDNIALTIGMLKSALSVAFTMGVGRGTRYCWLRDVLYNTLIGQSYGYFWTVNNTKVYCYTLSDALDDFLAAEYTFHSYYINPMINKLESDLSQGKYTRDSVILSQCNLTVGLFLDELTSARDYLKTNIEWMSAYSHYLISESRCENLSPQSASGGSAGTGTGSQIINYDRGYDGFDNSRWRQTIGVYAMTSDSMAPKGETFDYNSQEEGDGGGERISLMIRSWVQPEWSDVPLCNDDERDDFGRILYRIRTRGLADCFMAEHIHALLHRKPYKVEVLATVAQLLDIRNHWEDRYELDGKVGFINIVKYNVLKATGVHKAELEFYSI